MGKLTAGYFLCLILRPETGGQLSPLLEVTSLRPNQIIEDCLPLRAFERVSTCGPSYSNSSYQRLSAEASHALPARGSSTFLLLYDSTGGN
jgi:hypothetical protein